MSDYDRGVYAPESDAPLAFDPRQARGGGPAPFSLIVSLMILLVIAGGAYLFYRHGVRKAGETPQVVGAPIGETRTPPPAGAQPSDESAGLQVYKTEAQPSAEAPAPAFAPPPEQPQPLPAARPEPVAVAPLKGEAPPPVRVAQAPAPAVRPAPLKVAVAKPPALRGPAAASADDASDDDAGSAATAPAPAKLAKVVKPAPKAADAVASPGSPLVQIGAFTDSSQADKTWGDLARAMPTQMHGKTRKVETTTKDGKTFYRAYVGGFASRADAASFCTSLKAAGKPCFVK